MRNKIATVFIGILLFFLIFGSITLAGARTNCPTEGFVPCGTKDCPCQFCDFFVMFDRIVDFFLFTLAPSIAVLFLVIGGVMFITAGGSPERVQEGKKIMTSVGIGLLIIYGAYVLIDTFLVTMGVAQWTGLRTWFEFPCP